MRFNLSLPVAFFILQHLHSSSSLRCSTNKFLLLRVIFNRQVLPPQTPSNRKHSCCTRKVFLFSSTSPGVQVSLLYNQIFHTKVYQFTEMFRCPRDFYQMLFLYNITVFIKYYVNTLKTENCAKGDYIII